MAYFSRLIVTFLLALWSSSSFSQSLDYWECAWQGVTNIARGGTIVDACTKSARIGYSGYSFLVPLFYQMALTPSPCNGQIRALLR